MQLLLIPLLNRFRPALSHLYLTMLLTEEESGRVERCLYLIQQTKANDKKTRKEVTHDSSKFYLKFYLYILANKV